MQNEKTKVTLKARTQKVADGVWADEKGFQIPMSKISSFERKVERNWGKLFKSAKKINDELVAFKEEIRAICQEIYEEYMQLNNIEKIGKGNFTHFNYDRSIRIEVAINEPIHFSELEILACKAKLDEFLDEKVHSKDEFIKDMIIDSFETTRGNLDAKKVMSLLKWESKIKSPLFTEAMDLLKASIRRPASKTYFKIAVLDSEGKYQNIDLNFSSI